MKLHRIPAKTLFALLSLAGLSLGFGSGCATRGAVQESKPLPFHVAVIPSVREVVQDSLFVDEEGENGSPLDIEIDISQMTLSEKLVSALSGKHFVKATLLPFPDGEDAETFYANRQPFEQSDYWSKQIQTCEADVVLTSHLEYSSEVTGQPNDWFLINHVVYFFGGPLCWIANDRSYFVRSDLSARLYDSNLIFRDPRSIGDAESELLPIKTGFASANLDFFDRSPDPLTYLCGLLLPSGWFAVENEKVKSELEEAMVESLVEGLTAQVRDQNRDINEARDLVSFYFDLSTVQVRQDPTGVMSFSGELVLRTGRGVTRLSGIVLRVREREVQTEFEDSDRIEDRDLTRGAGGVGGRANPVYRYRVEESINAGQLLETVRITVFQGGQSSARRSYTFRVEQIEGAR